MKKLALATLFLLFICTANIAIAESKDIKIVLIGDSTVTDEAGWGKAFAKKFKSNVKVINLAMGGRSSKSWYNEKRLPRALKEKPDYVFIQFGHNGQPGKGPERETDPDTTYRDYLKLYVKEFKKIGAKPIIVSSVTRRNFDKDGKIKTSLTPWAKSAKAVAKEMNVPFIDLHTSSVEHHNKIGQKESMTYNPKKDDRTHFNKKGADAITNLIMKQLKAACPELYTYKKDK